jgi:phosphate transport system substrate-binding protein
MFSSVRRISALIALALLLPILAACGGGAATAPTTAPAPTDAPAPTTAAAATEAPTEASAPTEAATEAPTAEAAATAAPTTAAGAAVEPIELPAVTPAEVTGNIITAGSSTVFPLTERMAEVFGEDGFGGEITIDSIGTGGGFERFCTAGETDIANASRPIDEEETAACEAIGRTPIEFRVGTDALAVVVSNENTFLEELTLEQLGQIFSGQVTTWDQVDPSFPAEAIQLFSPGSDSGTYDYFVEEVLGDDEAGLQGSGAQFSENDNVLAQGVEGSPYAIGYFGYAYYAADTDRLKAIAIDGVQPNADTAEDGTYPLARPLFIYSAATILQEKPQVAAFINYYLTYVNDEITDVGYFPASVEALNEARQAWLDAQP